MPIQQTLSLVCSNNPSFLCINYVHWENLDSVDHIRCLLLARVLHVKYSIWEMLSPQVTLGSHAFVCQHLSALYTPKATVHVFKTIPVSIARKVES